MHGIPAGGKRSGTGVKKLAVIFLWLVVATLSGCRVGQVRCRGCFVHPPRPLAAKR